MAVDSSYLEFVLEQLSEFDESHDVELTTKKMFGGIGFFCDGLMFGMVGSGKFRLKVDEHNQQEYIDRGIEAFMSSKKKKGMPYYEVPVDILEDKSALAEWATKSYEAALRNKT